MTRYQRDAQHDKRIAQGHDYEGDAWKDSATGAIIWVAVGHDANAPTARFAQDFRNSDECGPPDEAAHTP